MRGLLADDRGFGQQPGEVLGEDFLALAIGDGDDIVRRLVLDLMRRQRLVARQDRALGGILHDRVNRAGEGVKRTQCACLVLGLFRLCC